MDFENKKKKRSSILKIPTTSEDEKTESVANKTSGGNRVSFSSNFIKRFATDEEKNTIWDETIEETITTESTRSSTNSNSTNIENFDMSIAERTMIVSDCSSDMELSESVFQFEENNPELFKNQVENMKEIDKENIYAVGKDFIPEDNIGIRKKSTNVTITSPQSLDLTCFSLPSDLSVSEIKNEPVSPKDTSTDMEFTCANPLQTAKLAQSNGVAENPDGIQDESQEMEFTCANPMLKAKIIQSNGVAEIPDEIQDKSQEMEFTCANPILKAKLLESHGVAETTDGIQDKSQEMEFTCANPMLKAKLIQSHGVAENPDGIQDESLEMEFTCANPIIKAKLIQSQGAAETLDGIQDESQEMEFTCANPMLKAKLIESHVVAEIPDGIQAEPRDMEFTCVNPILKAKVMESHAEISPGIQAESPDMELTLTNPSSRGENAVESPMKHVESQEKELACVNSLLQTDQIIENVAEIRHSENSTLVEATSFQNVTDDLLKTSTINRTYTVKTMTSKSFLELSSLDNQFSKLMEKDVTNDPEIIQIIEKEEENIAEKSSPNVTKNDDTDNLERLLQNKEATIIFDEISPDGLEITNDSMKSQDVSTNNTSMRPKITLAEVRARREAFRAERAMKNRNFSGEIPKYEPSSRELPWAECEEMMAKLKKLDEDYAKKYAAFTKYQNNILKEIAADIEKTAAESRAICDADNNSSLEDSEDLLPSLESKIREKAEMSECKWKVCKHEGSTIHIRTLCDKFEIRLEYNSSEIATKMDYESLLTMPSSTPIAYLVEREFVRTLTTDKMSNFIGNHYSVLTFLDYVQHVVLKIFEYYLEFKELQYSSLLLELTYDYRAYFTVLDVELIIKWMFKVDLSDLDNITKDKVEIVAVIGQLDKEKILGFVPECASGIRFLHTFVEKIKEYLESLKKREKRI